MTLRIFQIYFDEATRAHCIHDPRVTLVENSFLTPYFENTVILGLRPYVEEHVGVWSHQAAVKIRGEGNPDFSMDRLARICEENDFDLLGFHGLQRRPVILSAAVAPQLDALFDYLLGKLGVRYRSHFRPRFPVLQNHFVAKASVMNAYAAFLQRAMGVMEADDLLRTALFETAPYKTDGPIRYTFHPFVCERLVSAYLEEHPQFVCRLFSDYRSLR